MHQSNTLLVARAMFEGCVTAQIFLVHLHSKYSASSRRTKSSGAVFVCNRVARATAEPGRVPSRISSAPRDFIRRMLPCAAGRVVGEFAIQRDLSFQE